MRFLQEDRKPDASYMEFQDDIDWSMRATLMKMACRGPHALRTPHPKFCSSLSTISTAFSHAGILWWTNCNSPVSPLSSLQQSMNAKCQTVCCGVALSRNAKPRTLPLEHCAQRNDEPAFSRCQSQFGTTGFVCSHLLHCHDRLAECLAARSPELHLLSVDATGYSFAVLGKRTFLTVEPRAACPEAFYEWLPAAQRYVELI